LLNLNSHNKPIHPIFQDKKIFKFLYTGEDNERKNIDALLKAYLSEFNYHENVALIIKTNNDIGQKVENIKQSLRKSYNGQYPIICLINNFLSEAQMTSLYQYSDCFMVTSKGESFCRGAAESLAAGKPVITNNKIGTVDFVNSDVGWIVPSTDVPAYCERPPISELYTCQEQWQDISIYDLQSSMRAAASDKELYKYKCDNIQKSNISQQFSYKYIGQRLLQALEA
jgi:glycosyltransferase involved in cell wall biosynthesis